MKPDISKSLDQAFSYQVEKRGFSKLGPPADRHGSWEWVFLKKSAGLNRFVFVAFTDPVPFVGDQPPFYSVEVWAGADDDRRFVKRLAGALRAVEGQLQKDLPKPLGESLDRAMTEAERFGRDDLTESYLPSRAR